MSIIPINQKARQSGSTARFKAAYQEGASCAGRLGGDPSLNPHESGTAESAQWLRGFLDASDRLNKLFLAWLALGHSIPYLAIGKAGQALGPMVAGLVASNGNTAGALLVGALAAHDGKSLKEILPPDEVARAAFEATQYGITGHDLPIDRPALAAGTGNVKYFYDLACEIDRFREPGSETEVEVTKDSEGEGAKVARVKFDLAAYLKVLVEGLPNGKKDGS